MSSERKRPRSLTWILVRRFAVAVAVPLLGLGILLFVRSIRSQEQTRRAELRELAKIYTYQLTERYQLWQTSEPPREPDWARLVWGPVESSTLPATVSLFALDTEGRLLYHSATTAPPRVETRLEAGFLTAWLERQDHVTASATLPVRGGDGGSGSGSGGGESLTVVLAEPARSFLASPEARTTLLVLIAALLATLVMVIPAVRVELQPLDRLRAESRRLLSDESGPADGDDDPSSSELDELSDALGRIAHSLGRSQDSLRLLGRIGRGSENPLDEIQIVESLVAEARDALDCRDLRCVLFPEEPDPGDRFEVFEASGRRFTEPFTDSQLAWLADPPTDPETAASPFERPAIDGARRWRYPVRVDGRLRALLIVDWDPSSLRGGGTQDVGRSLARHLELSLSTVTLTSGLERFADGAITSLARAIDAASPWTRGHSDRVAQISAEFGEYLGLGPEKILTLRRGGLVHDIGKIGIDRTILQKTGPLTPEERVEIERHPSIGFQILQPVPGFEEVLGITHQHHERWNGGGYPQGLQGDEIDHLARIVAIADVFDALTSDRPYRVRFSYVDSLEVLREGRDRDFDPELVDAFLDMLGSLGGDRRLYHWQPRVGSASEVLARAGNKQTG